MSSSAKPPFQEHEVRDYERRRYRGLDQRIVHRREVRILEAMFRIIEERSSASDSPLALDAPCGYGRFSTLLGSRFRLVDADLSLAMVKRALSRGDIPTIPMGIVCNMTRGLPFRRGVFRLILSMRFFHHLHRAEERRAVLEEFARTTAEWLILSYYQANALHRLQRILRRAFKRSKTRIKMIGRREFRGEVGESGLEVVRVFPLFRGVHAQHIALLRKS